MCSNIYTKYNGNVHILSRNEQTNKQIKHPPYDKPNKNFEILKFSSLLVIMKRFISLNLHRQQTTQCLPNCINNSDKLQFWGTQLYKHAIYIQHSFRNQHCSVNHWQFSTSVIPLRFHWRILTADKQLSVNKFWSHHYPPEMWIYTLVHTHISVCVSKYIYISRWIMRTYLLFTDTVYFRSMCRWLEPPYFQLVFAAHILFPLFHLFATCQDLFPNSPYAP